MVIKQDVIRGHYNSFFKKLRKKIINKQQTFLSVLEFSFSSKRKAFLFLFEFIQNPLYFYAYYLLAFFQLQTMHNNLKMTLKMKKKSIIPKYVIHL